MTAKSSIASSRLSPPQRQVNAVEQKPNKDKLTPVSITPERTGSKRPPQAEHPKLTTSKYLRGPTRKKTNQERLIKVQC